MKYKMTNKTGVTPLAVRIPGGHAICPKGGSVEIDSGDDPFDDLYLERLETAGMVIKAEGGAEKPKPKAEAKAKPNTASDKPTSAKPDAE